MKLLRQFVEQQGPAVSQISSALKQGDSALAERLAHTLKGVAGNIGAKSVQAAAGDLEKAIRTKGAASEINSARQRVATALDPLVAEIQSALSLVAPEIPVESTTATAVDPAQAREAAAQLTKLLSEFDPGAADFIEANGTALRSLFGDGAWPQFEKLVQSYAFAEAQAQLDQALEGVSSL